MNNVFLVSASVLWVLGGYVYYKKRNTVALFFMVINLGIGLWHFCIFLLEEKTAIINVNYVSKIQLLSALIFGNGFYYFSFFYPEVKYPPKIGINALIFLVLVYLIFFTDYVTVVILEEGKVRFIDGFGYTLYAAYGIFLFFSFIYQLIKHYVIYIEYRLHISYLLLGFTFFAIVATTCDIILPVLDNYEFLLVGYFSGVLIPILFAYIITKHSLLDLNIVIKRATATAITCGIIVTSLLAIQQTFKDNETLNTLLLIPGALFWALFARPLENFLITTARRKFVRGWYDPDSIFTTLTDTLAGEKSKAQILHATAQALDNTLQLECCHTFVRTEGQPTAYQSPQQQVIMDNPQLISAIQTIDHPCSMDQVDSVVADFCYGLGYHYGRKAVLLPFYSPEFLEGFLILGEKSNQLPYSAEDFSFLKRLSHYIAASLYRLTPFETLEKIYFANREKLHQAELQLMRTERIEAVAHATRQCHHEIKTPLSIIKLAVGRVNSMQDIPSFKATVYEEIDRALAVINETLIITDGIKPGQAVKTPININDAIRRCFKLLPQSGYRLVQQLNDVPNILGVLSDLEIVFTNLMTNAKEAMPDGGTLTIHSYQQDQEIVITFSDTGHGVADSMKHRLWDPYCSGQQTKLGNSTAGRGWGMTIVHRIIREHGGTINLNSEVANGAEFIIKLPVPKLQ